MSKKDISTRQQEIIDASGKILITKGIKGLTTKNLAMEMGFSESALYRHFKNKEDIIVLLFTAMLENFTLRLDEIVSRETPALDKLNSLFESQFNYISQNPHFTVAVLADDICFEGENVKVALLNIFAYKGLIIMKILQQGKEEGSIRTDIDNEHLLHTIIGSFRLQMLKWRLDDFKFNLPEEGKKLMSSILTLIKK